MNYVSYQNWSFPTSIRYGPGRIKELSGICQNKEIKRPFVVTDRGSGDLDLIKDILLNLKKERS